MKKKVLLLFALGMFLAAHNANAAMTISNSTATNDENYTNYQFSYTGTPTNFRVYIDTDRNANTGYSYAGIGAEYLIQNGNLYKYTNTTGTKTLVGKIFYASNTGGVIKYQVSRLSIGEIATSGESSDLVYEVANSSTTQKIAKFTQTYTDNNLPPPILSGINFSVDGNGINFSNTSIKLQIDNQLKLKIAFIKNGVPLNFNQPQAPHKIQINNTWISSFTLDSSKTILSPIQTEFGKGQSLELVGTASAPNGSQIRLIEHYDMFDDYPDTILTHANFETNDTTGFTVNAIWDNALLLDRKLLKSSANRYDFKMVSMGDSWGNAIRDRMWTINSTSNFKNYNGGDTSNPEFSKPWGGGGTPVTSVWSPEMGITIAVTEKKPQILGVPLQTQTDGTVLLGVYETNDLGILSATKPIASVQSNITVHSGDFYSGVSTYGKLMRSYGIVTKYKDSDYEPYFCTFGLDDRLKQSPANPKLVENLLYIPKDLGIKTINIDSGWDNGTGSCTPNTSYFANEKAFADWIEKLHSQGLQVSLWWDPGFADVSWKSKYPNWFIKKKDGTFWQDDWTRLAMDPTVSSAVNNVKACAQKLLTPKAQGGWGVDRLFLDGMFTRPPDYSGRNASPHETERQDNIFYQAVHDVAQSIRPDATIEACPCGGVVNIWNAPYISQFTTADPDQMALRPHEFRTKLYKALFGSNTPVNSDHIEGAGINLDLYYSLPLAVGLGDVLQTYFWENTWRAPSTTGLGDKLLYQKWFNLYRELQLSKANYRGDLYDLAFDKPGSHAIEKNNDMFYLFAPQYGQTFSGTVELRGLQVGTQYSIIDYDKNIILATGVGPKITIPASIAKNKVLVIQAKKL